MATSQHTHRAVGVVRVSRVGGRAGERFVSPEIQREHIEAECGRRGLQVIETIEELDVSGGKALDKRPGLSQALAAVEAGRAEAIVFAYRDRMDRSILTGSELCERMDAAGGLLVADGNVITHATHDGWRRSTFESFLNEDQRRAVGEKMQAVQERCVAEGRPPWSRVALGYRRSSDGRLVVEPGEVPIVNEAFKMRAGGESLKVIRKMLQGHGVERSYRGIQVMLANRIYLGELHFGKLVNLAACEPIVDRALFDRVARSFVPRGPKPKSPRLLSRLGVLRCGTCGARLSAMTMPKQGGYPIYRCSSTADCAHHVAISATRAERQVIEHVRARLADVEGRAEQGKAHEDAARRLAAAQQALEGAVRAFDGLGDMEAARERLQQLRADVDEAQDRVDQLGRGAGVLTINADRDWDKLTVEEQRGLIRAVVASATVAPGRGEERITFA